MIKGKFTVYFVNILKNIKNERDYFYKKVFDMLLLYHRLGGMSRRKWKDFRKKIPPYGRGGMIVFWFFLIKSGHILR